MNPLFLSSARLIGSYVSNNPREVEITRDWWANDGLVSVISAKGPHVGSNDKIVSFNGSPQKGVWNYLGVKPTDHIDIVGLYNCNSKLKNEYSKIAKMLSTLPN